MLSILCPLLIYMHSHNILCQIVLSINLKVKFIIDPNTIIFDVLQIFGQSSNLSQETGSGNPDCFKYDKILAIWCDYIFCI